MMKATTGTALASHLPGGASWSRENMLLLLLKMRTFIALFLILGFFSIMVPGFLATGSLIIMVKHIAINAFLALGITFVIITAGIDLHRRDAGAVRHDCRLDDHPRHCLADVWHRYLPQCLGCGSGGVSYRGTHRCG